MKDLSTSIDRKVPLQTDHQTVSCVAKARGTIAAKDCVIGTNDMQHGRELGGIIFKHDGRNYLVLEDNQWDAEHLFVKSVDALRETQLLPRSLIDTEVAAQRLKAG